MGIDFQKCKKLAEIIADDLSNDGHEIYLSGAKVHLAGTTIRFVVYPTGDEHQAGGDLLLRLEDHPWVTGQKRNRGRATFRADMSDLMYDWIDHCIARQMAARDQPNWGWDDQAEWDAFMELNHLRTKSEAMSKEMVNLHGEWAKDLVVARKGDRWSINDNMREDEARAAMAAIAAIRNQGESS